MNGRFASMLVLLLVLGFFACGGGGKNVSRPDLGPTEDADVMESAPDQGVVEDDAVLPDDRSVQHDEVSKGDDGGEEGVVDAELDTNLDKFEFDVPPLECPCDESIEAWVCGIDGKTYKNDQCAKCAICKQDLFKCNGCTGAKECDLTDPMGQNGWIKLKAKCEECICREEDECAALQVPAPCGPVCDINNQTFQTLCDMQKWYMENQGYACNQDYQENFYYFGECVVTPPCPQCENSPKDPVCGSDNVTYSNLCALFACPTMQGVTPQYLGACLGENFCQQCATEAVEPVCASDGITYANACAATQCAQKEVVYVYPPDSTTPCCASAGITGNKVCGSDFKTYPNEETLMCLGLDKKYDGECICDCPGTGNQVCAGDGNVYKTYPNDCWVTCLGLTKLYDGACKTECPQCTVTEFTNPSCGTISGKYVTYPDRCWLDCKGATFVKDGLCDDCVISCGPLSNPYDTPNPMCGPDLVTYPNACYPTKCRGFEQSQLNPGACQ